MYHVRDAHNCLRHTTTDRTEAMVWANQFGWTAWLVLEEVGA